MKRNFKAIIATEFGGGEFKFAETEEQANEKIAAMILECTAKKIKVVNTWIVPVKKAKK